MNTFIIFIVCCLLAWKGIFTAMQLLKKAEKKFEIADKQSDNELQVWERNARAYGLLNEHLKFKARIKLFLVLYLAVIVLTGLGLDFALEKFETLKDGLSFDGFMAALILLIFGLICIGYLVLRIIMRLTGQEQRLLS